MGSAIIVSWVALFQIIFTSAKESVITGNKSAVTYLIQTDPSTLSTWRLLFQPKQDDSHNATNSSGFINSSENPLFILDSNTEIENTPIDALVDSPSSTQTVPEIQSKLSLTSRTVTERYQTDDSISRFKYEVTSSTKGKENTNSTNNQKKLTNVSCPPLSVLDFLDLGKLKNETAVEIEWPCEVRTFWLSIYWLATLVRSLFHYVMIVIVALGMLLNIISFCALNSPSMKTCSVSVYLRALAVADSGVLIYNCTALIRSSIDEFNALYLNNTWLCTLDRVLFVTSVYYSSWLVVALSLERLIMVTFPFSNRYWGSTRMATWVVLILAVIILTMSVIRSQINGFEKESVFEYEVCGSKSQYWSGYLYIFIGVGSWIPTILILLSNIYLMVQIQISASRRNNLSAFRNQGDPRTFRMTRMLLMVSASYLITVLPLAIASGTQIYWKAAIGKQPSLNAEDRVAYIAWKKQLLLLKWIRSLFFFFYMMNFGCNFFLYYVSGQMFRKAVKDFLWNLLPSFCLIKKNSINTLASYNNNNINGRSSLSNSNLTQLTNSQNSNSSIVSQFGYCNSAFINTETDRQLQT